MSKWGERPAIDALDWQGIPVECSADAWSAIVQKHPDMKDRLASVEAVVRDPDFVMRDRDISVHLAFYRREPSGRWQKVVVRYFQTDQGRGGSVVTAFQTRRVRTGDGVLYDRDND